MKDPKKQTAVEWLENKLKNMVLNGADFGEDYEALLVHIQQAKQMEKVQIYGAHEAGVQAHMDYTSQEIEASDPFDWADKASGTFKGSQQYYNETYNTQVDGK